MKPTILDNILSQKELFYMYNQIVSTPNWKLNGLSGSDKDPRLGAPVLTVKVGDIVEHHPFFLWGQTLVYRIAKLLDDKNKGIPTQIIRMWLNVTYDGKKSQHWLHRDEETDLQLKSIVLFMTPVWQPDWRGSFYVDGEEFKFKPGSAVIFDSEQYHKGESPESETYNWQRITCNILVG